MTTIPPRLLAVLAALTLLLAACSGDDPVVEATAPPATAIATATASASPATDPPVPSPTAVPASPSATPTAEEDPATTPVSYFLVRDHASGVWVEPLTTQAEGAGVAAAAFEAMLNGPTGGLSRPLFEGTVVNGLTVDDGLLTIDLTLGEGGLGAAYEQAAIDAIVLTGTQFSTVDRVRILLDGAPAETLSGHVDISGELEPDPFALSPIIVESVTVGDGAVTVAGTANVFEATIELELRGADGTVLESTFTTATCGTGCRGEFTHTFSDADPAGGTVVLRETDPSDGEGRPPYEVSAPY